MSRALLDVNVLLALSDPDHADHARVHEWAATGLADGWASCAITENGFVRVLSQPRYPGALPVAEALAVLRRSTRSAAHEFWPCGLALTSDVLNTLHLLGHRQITDAYLLALAVHHGGRLVSLDRSVDVATVRGATGEHLHIL